MDTYLFSIHKRWNDLIFIEKIKKLEIRKSAPKPPFKAIIYEPKNGGGCGKVIGEWICERVSKYSDADLSYFEFARELNGIDKYPIENGACLTIKQMHEYSNKGISAIEITAPVLYNKPKELGEYKTVRFVRGYHKKNETMVERLQNSKRVEVTYVSKAPQNYMRIQCTEED